MTGTAPLGFWLVITPVRIGSTATWPGSRTCRMKRCTTSPRSRRTSAPVSRGPGHSRSTPGNCTGRAAKYAPTIASLAAGCDLNAAYNPNHPCTTLMQAATQPVPVQTAMVPQLGVGGCDLNAAYDPKHPCTALTTGSRRSPAPGLRPRRKSNWHRSPATPMPWTNLIRPAPERRQEREHRGRIAFGRRRPARLPAPPSQAASPSPPPRSLVDARVAVDLPTR